jgi:hypothetical protein
LETANQAQIGTGLGGGGGLEPDIAEPEEARRAVGSPQVILVAGVEISSNM